MKWFLKQKKSIGIDRCIKLKSLGLSLSGAEQVQKASKIEKLLFSDFPHVTECVGIKGDTMGSIATAIENRTGMVLISEVSSTIGNSCNSCGQEENKELHCYSGTEDF